MIPDLLAFVDQLPSRTPFRIFCRLDLRRHGRHGRRPCTQTGIARKAQMHRAGTSMRLAAYRG
jgi:hypothetical protein